MHTQLVRRLIKLLAGTLLTSGAFPIALAAQSAGDRAAWNAIILSPVGALAPLARDPVDDEVRQPNLWVRYGRWRYNSDDAIHNNIGVTVFHQLPLPSSELSITAAYVSLSCGQCPSWISGGASINSTLWQQGDLDEGYRSLGVRADVGGSHYHGSSQTNAGSIGAAVVAGVGVPLTENSHLSATISPGVGMGRIALVDGVHQGTRPTLGAALAWIHATGLAINLGIQRIIISGGPTEVGAALGWNR